MIYTCKENSFLKGFTETSFLTVSSAYVIISECRSEGLKDPWPSG